MSIYLKYVTKVFGTRKVLDDLSLDVRKGEFHAILGPSGEGKSTILSIVAGLLKPDSGEVWLSGRSVNRISPQKRNVGFVFQDYALFPHLTVGGNMAYGLSARGLGKAEIQERIRRYLARVRLTDYADAYPFMLSGGQKQRVALARALATEPDVLLLDEPLSHLDASLHEQLISDLKAIQQQVGITTLYVTHNRTEAMNLGHRISVLHKGRIEQTESPNHLFYHPKTPFVASFVGVPNVFDAKLLKAGKKTSRFRIANPGAEHMEIEAENYPIFFRKKSLRLCLHPENIRLCEEKGGGNRFPGQVLEVYPKGAVTDLLINIAGLSIRLRTPKSMFSENDKTVWIHFPPDALHPVCGRTQRLPQHQRACGCG